MGRRQPSADSTAQRGVSASGQTSESQCRQTGVLVTQADKRQASPEACVLLQERVRAGEETGPLLLCAQNLSLSSSHSSSWNHLSTTECSLPFYADPAYTTYWESYRDQLSTFSLTIMKMTLSSECYTPRLATLLVSGNSP